MRSRRWEGNGKEEYLAAANTGTKKGAGAEVKRVEVECYAGYRADQRPVRVRLGEESLEVSEVEDRWYSPGETFFRVRMANGDRYVLRHVEAQDTWSLEGFRGGAN